jgi:uncharacterized protein YhaN
MDILSQVSDEVGAMSDDDIRAEMAKLQEQKAKQAKRQAEYNSSPEAKEKRAAYNAARSQDPEVKAKRAEYMQRPEVKEKMKAYRQKRNERTKAILAKAAELGITADTV